MSSSVVRLATSQSQFTGEQRKSFVNVNINNEIIGLVAKLPKTTILTSTQGRDLPGVDNIFPNSRE